METARAKPARILIVDDEPRNLKLMTVLLQEEGYAFDTAGSGREALEKVRDFRPDLVFLDVMMPGMDGFEVCRRLRSEPAVCRIPVVLVTALTTRIPASAAWRSGRTTSFPSPSTARNSASGRATSSRLTRS